MLAGIFARIDWLVWNLVAGVMPGTGVRAALAHGQAVEPRLK